MLPHFCVYVRMLVCTQRAYRFLCMYVCVCSLAHWLVPFELLLLLPRGSRVTTFCRHMVHRCVCACVCLSASICIISRHLLAAFISTLSPRSRHTIPICSSHSNSSRICLPSSSLSTIFLSIFAFFYVSKHFFAKPSSTLDIIVSSLFELQAPPICHKNNIRYVFCCIPCNMTCRHHSRKFDSKFFRKPTKCDMSYIV